jgi:hypothetical protein
MTKIEALKNDAKTAGWTVQDGGFGTTITKVVRLNKTATRTIGLTIDVYGTAFRVDVALAVASGIRSVKVMREILGL